MTRENFIELVYNYGTEGTKVFDNLNLKDIQIEDVTMAWAEFDADDTDEETKEKFLNYYNSFCLNAKWGVNYSPTDFEGYHKGTGGMVCYDEKTLTNSLENATSI